MKQFWIFVICLLPLQMLHGQISHGGRPLFPPNVLRSSVNSFFIEMPSFDVNELLKEDQLNEQNMRGSFRFAHKFNVEIEKGKDGLNYRLPDGTKVWQVGIRSKGAYSINVLFSEFHIPEGGKLFLYNSGRTHVIGSFTHENNSDDGMLPTRPVMGDEIIIEYNEPENAAFEGKLKMTEVNHDYANLFAYEPKNDATSHACMPDVICQTPDDPNLRSALLLIINGNTACSGTLLNNTMEDGTPYVLTASHCLNGLFTKRSYDDYLKAAGSIVTFFNYYRPICHSNIKMKGVEEMTLAGSTPVSIIDSCDITMIRMNETPPDYYMPYYAGWDVTYNTANEKQESVPFVNLHHPGGSVTKYGMSNQPAELSTYYYTIADSKNIFLPDAHWKVTWDTGASEGGSSGSPLFNNHGRLIGALTGGSSSCVGTIPVKMPDYFFALFRGWNYGNRPENRLKFSLDPNNTGRTAIDGFDRYSRTPMVILSNANYNGSDALLNTSVNKPEQGYLFGHNSLERITEFAESFHTEQEANLIGTYLMAPAIDFVEPVAVKINVYSGSLKPDCLITSAAFYPKYTTYQSGDIVSQPRDTYRYPFQSFIKFEDELKVKGDFFIAYEIAYPYQKGNEFSVYNAVFTGENAKNAAWLKTTTGEWIAADQYAVQPVKASLAVQAMIRYVKDDGILPPVRPEQSEIIRYDRSSRQLYIDAAPGENGTVEIYVVTGLLIQRISYSGPSSLTLQPLPSGTVGIIKAVSGKRQEVVKVVF